MKPRPPARFLHLPAGLFPLAPMAQVTFPSTDFLVEFGDYLEDTGNLERGPTEGFRIRPGSSRPFSCFFRCLSLPLNFRIT
jgi:hypothetical protein